MFLKHESHLIEKQDKGVSFFQINLMRKYIIKLVVLK